MTDTGWFEADGATASIRAGSAESPASWPRLAVDRGVVPDEDAYYDALHEATVAAARAAVESAEQADDRQLIHAIRALDDCRRTANELAERLAEWGGTVDPDAGTGVAYARTLLETEADLSGPAADRVHSLAERVVALEDEADALEAHVDRQAPIVAPNLAALAGPQLAARLISLAGGLESLAKKPSGTVQVLGAEEALFAHLRGHASSPKHGVIFTHEAVRGTRMADRGSAARALAGKLAIAARIDHYSGDRRPELEAEFTDRLETIRARATAEDDGSSPADDTESDGHTEGDTHGGGQ